MNVLEKNLEEIKEQRNSYFRYSKSKIGKDSEKGISERITEIGYVEEIIHSHMDEIPNCEGCSRRKWYQKGYEDGKKDNDWIPVEERLPNQNGVYNVTRLVDDAFISDSAYFDGQDTWHNDNRVNHIRPYLTDIVAWQPLPELYKAMEG